MRPHIPLALFFPRSPLFFALFCTSPYSADVPVREMIGPGKVALADRNWDRAADLADRLLQIDCV